MEAPTRAHTRGMEANMKLDIRDRRTQLGLALVALGLLALLADFGLFASLGRIVGLVLFGAAGVLVLGMYRSEPRRFWMLPVGFGLLGLGVASLDLPWSGGAFLGSIGLGFLAIWLTDPKREHWWALIPTGVLLTLGVVATYDEWLAPRGDFAGTLFFLGLAATFAVLYLLPSVNQRWAIWPALALGVVALLTMSFQGGWVVPILLIVVGAWLLTRQSRPQDVPHDVPPDVGPTRTSSSGHPSERAPKSEAVSSSATQREQAPVPPAAVPDGEGQVGSDEPGETRGETRGGERGEEPRQDLNDDAREGPRGDDDEDWRKG